MRFLGTALILTSAALLAEGEGSSRATGDATFQVVSDVQYCTGGGQPLLMDVFVAEHRLRTPTQAVLWLQGRRVGTR